MKLSYWISYVTISGLLLSSNFSSANDINIIPGCTRLGSNLINNNHNVATNGAGIVVYSWIDANGIIHASMTKPDTTACSELPSPQIQKVIPARTKLPQITLDNAGNIILAFLTATSNDLELPPNAPQHINGIKVLTLNVNSHSKKWIDISTGLKLTESSTAAGNFKIELSMVGNGRGDTMLIWYEEQSHLNDRIVASILNSGINGKTQWLSYIFDAGTNILSHNINSGTAKPNAAINASGNGMFFWLGSFGGTPPDQCHLRAGAINASKAQKKPPASKPQDVAHHITFPLQDNGPIAYAGSIDEEGDALAIWPDVNSGFQKMQYNTYSAKTGKWKNTNPDRFIADSSTTITDNSILIQLASNSNKTHPYTFAVWNQFIISVQSSLRASIYNKVKDTWTSSLVAADRTSGEFGIGITCAEEAILVYKNSDPIKAILYPNFNHGSLNESQDLGLINPNQSEAAVTILPVTSIVRECLPGNSRLGAVLWGTDSTGESFSLNSAFLEAKPPLSILFPPLNFKGEQVKNEFIFQTDVTNVLTWIKNPKGPQVISYKIYRNALTNLIGKVSAGDQLKFEDHNRKTGVKYTYYVVGIDKNGQNSTPAVLILKGNKQIK